MIDVVPSLPASSFDELRDKIGRVAGLVDSFQIDICDGEFVDSVSWPMHAEDRAQFEKITSGAERLPHADKMAFEVHFMTHEPERLLPEWLKAGVMRALFHIEARHDWAEIQEVGKDIELGISLLIDTPLERIDAYAERISVVQLMGIAEIGVQGQPFDERVLERVREVKKRYPDVIIEIDGAVNRETAPLLAEAGAMRLAPGSYVLKNDNPKKAIEYLRSL